VVPVSLAISVTEYPFDIGIAICRRIACPRCESRSQLISPGIVETDELDSRPFVDAIPEGPSLPAVP
jgi:hypothetical protein